MVIPKKIASFNLCGFSQTECCQKERPIPLTFHLKGPWHGCKSWDVFFLRWLFKLPLDYDNSLKEQYKTTFITNQGAFVWVIMPFGLKNAPPSYQRIVSMAFKEYLGIFMKLFMDNFNVFNDRNTHLQKLHLLFWQVSQIWYQLKSWQMHVSGVFQSHFGIHCVTRRQVIISKEIFGDYHMLQLKTPKGI